MKRKLYKAAALLLAALFLTLQCHGAPTTSAKCCVLMDADTGAVLFAQKENERALIASTTKIMTAVVVLEHCEPDREFVVPVEATGIEGSSMYLQAGECLTIRELLYGLLLQSGNDAAVALALACSDSVEEFVALMNVQAQKLGMENSHFENPNGLDGEKHYSSAMDLAKLTRHALKNEEFSQIVATKNKQIGSRYLRNHNRLLWSVEGCIGVKTGYTKAAGRTLVTAVTRNGRTLIAVTLCDGDDWRDHAALYDYGFSQYEQGIAVAQGQQVAELTLMDGTVCPLLAGEDVSVPLLPGEALRVVPVYPRAPFLPEGEVFGDVYLGERYLKRISLQWEEQYEGTNSENHSVSRPVLPPEGGGMAFGGAH